MDGIEIRFPISTSKHINMNAKTSGKKHNSNCFKWHCVTAVQGTECIHIHGSDCTIYTYILIARTRHQKVWMYTTYCANCDPHTLWQVQASHIIIVATCMYALSQCGMQFCVSRRTGRYFSSSKNNKNPNLCEVHCPGGALSSTNYTTTSSPQWCSDKFSRTSSINRRKVNLWR